MTESGGSAQARRVMLVVGTTSGGTGAHVLLLAGGLGARGIAVSVAGPPAADRVFSFASLPAVEFFPVAIGDRPRASDLLVLLRLRRLLVRWAADDPRPAAAVVHAHGLRAGAFTVFALAGRRRRAAARVVVTVHNAPPIGGGLTALVYRALAWLVAKGADLVLCVSPDLEEAMRATGARHVTRAVVAAPAASGPAPAAAIPTGAIPSAAIPPSGHPVVLAVGRLAAQKGFGTFLDAAVQWQELDPRPSLAIAGDGPLAGDLRAKAAARGIDVAFLGHVANVPALLASAAVFVMPSWWEGQPLVLQEALRAGVPIVATRVGGVPDLVGEDAALLVEPRDAAALAGAVLAVLTDPALAARLRAAATRRAAALPTEAGAVAAVLAAYAAASV